MLQALPHRALSNRSLLGSIFCLRLCSCAISTTKVKHEKPAAACSRRQHDVTHFNCAHRIAASHKVTKTDDDNDNNTDRSCCFCSWQSKQSLVVNICTLRGCHSSSTQSACFVHHTSTELLRKTSFLSHCLPMTRRLGEKQKLHTCLQNNLGCRAEAAIADRGDDSHIDRLFPPALSEEDVTQYDLLGMTNHGYAVVSLI